MILCFYDSNNMEKFDVVESSINECTFHSITSLSVGQAHKEKHELQAYVDCKSLKPDITKALSPTFHVIF